MSTARLVIGATTVHTSERVAGSEPDVVVVAGTGSPAPASHAKGVARSPS